MHMRKCPGVKAYAFPLGEGWEVSWSDDPHAIPEYVPEHVLTEFISFCLSPFGAGIDDVIVHTREV